MLNLLNREWFILFRRPFTASSAEECKFYLEQCGESQAVQNRLDFLSGF